MNCLLCHTPFAPFDTATVLGKYTVQYFRCPDCGMVRTEDPFWTQEAYANPITTADIGLVQRNLTLSTLTASLLVTTFDANAQFLDFGGGYGLFVRLMRDKGFQFLRHDPSCPNLFAKGFDVSLPFADRHFELVTAFEVLEHLPSPLEEFQSLRSITDSILVSTLLLPSPPPRPTEWWYYGREHGQHVTWFSKKALSLFADRLGMRLLSNGKTLHLLTRRPTSSLAFRIWTHHRIASLVNLLHHRRSLLPQDHQSTGTG